MELWKDLASLAAAAGPDGGLAVAKTLRALLVDQVPSDRAEMVVEGPQGFDRKSLTEDPAPLVGRTTCSRRSRRRGRRCASTSCRSSRSIRRRSSECVRSACDLCSRCRLSAAGGAKGVVVLLRDYPFAFAGVPLYRIEPMMAIAGIAMTQALALTAARAASALGADREALERENAELLGSRSARRTPAAERRGALEARRNG